MTDLWFTEMHEKDAKFCIKITQHLHSEKTKFQQIDIYESETFGRFLSLDGFMMLTEKDEFIYHDMITHTALAVNPDI